MCPSLSYSVGGIWSHCAEALHLWGCQNILWLVEFTRFFFSLIATLLLPQVTPGRMSTSSALGYRPCNVSRTYFFLSLTLTLFTSKVLKNATGSLSSVWLKNRPCCTALWRYSLKSSLRFSGRVVAEEVLQLFPF